MSRINKPPMILSNIAKNFTKNFTKNFANKEGTVTVVVVGNHYWWQTAVCSKFQRKMTLCAFLRFTKTTHAKILKSLVGNGLNFQPICSPCPPTGTNSVLLRGKKSLREGCLRSSERLQVFHRVKISHSVHSKGSKIEKGIRT